MNEFSQTTIKLPDFTLFTLFILNKEEGYGSFFRIIGGLAKVIYGPVSIFDIFFSSVQCYHL
jgi:hypothetical protein